MKESDDKLKTGKTEIVRVNEEMADPEFATYWRNFVKGAHKKRKQHYIPDTGEDGPDNCAKPAGEMVVEERKNLLKTLLCNVLRLSWLLQGRKGKPMFGPGCEKCRLGFLRDYVLEWVN